MTLNRSENDGGLYGTAPVILAREKNGQVDFLIGYGSPWGPITMSEFEGSRFVEKSKGQWEELGFTVTETPAIEEARRLSRERLAAQMNPKPFPKG